MSQNSWITIAIAFASLLIAQPLVFPVKSQSDFLSRFLSNNWISAYWPRMMAQSMDRPADLGDRVVVVVGAGLAGLSAAAQLVLDSASFDKSKNSIEKVLLLDKGSVNGRQCNSARASSGLSAAGTRHQHRAGVLDDSADLHTADTLAAGHGMNWPRLVGELTQGGTRSKSPDLICTRRARVLTFPM